MPSALQAVLDELNAAGFESLELPLRVAGAAFDFEAAVVGTGVSHDLVLLATNATHHQRLVRLTQGLARALDHVESRRPVTLILLGEAPSFPVQDNLERNCRLLLLDSEEPDQAQVRQAISVLMPLSLPQTRGGGKDPIAEVVRSLGATATAEHLRLIEAAPRGADAVRDALRQYIDETFEEDPAGSGPT